MNREPTEVRDAALEYAVPRKLDLSPEYKQAEVGMIPNDWDIADLGNLSVISSGGTPSRSVSRFWSGPIPWVTTAEVDFREILRTGQSITRAGLENSAATLLRPGTILMALYGQGKTRGKVGVLGIEAATNQACAAISPNARVDGEFLFHYLRSQYRIIRKLSNTGNQENLNSSIVRSIRVILPPKHEQRAIAEALSDVDGLLGSLDKLIAKKRAIKQAAMQQLLTGKTRLPGFSGEWETKRLGDIGIFSKGRGIKRDDVSDLGVPCIRYGELYTRYHNYITHPVSRISSAVAATALPIKHSTLLFAGSGETAEEIGKCAAYLGTEEAYAGGDIVVLTPREGDPLYLGHLMNHQTVVEQKARMGQGDAVVHISAGNLAQIEVSLPPKAEQTAIAAVLSDMDAEITALEQRREKTRALKQGMMQQLLTGRVRLVDNAQESEALPC